MEASPEVPTVSPVCSISAQIVELLMLPDRNSSWRGWQGKISFLVAVAWGNVNIPTGKAREEWKPGRKWQLYRKDRSEVLWVKRRSSSFCEYLGCAETLKINPLWSCLCICSFPKLHSPAFKPVFNHRTWGILPALDTKAFSSDVPGVGRMQPTQHTTGRAAPDWLCSLLKKGVIETQPLQEHNSSLDCAIKPSTGENSQFSQEW